MKYKITDLEGKTHIVEHYSVFAKERGLRRDGFNKVLQGKQKKCYGGYTICRLEDESLKETDNTKGELLSWERSYYFEDFIREGNTFKIKFTHKTPEFNKSVIRKVDLVPNKTGNTLICAFTKVSILEGEVCGCMFGVDQKKVYFSVAEFKRIGYSFDVDFNYEPKKHKKVIVDTTSIEDDLIYKMERIMKEIAETQKKLNQLKGAKEMVGRSLSKYKTANDDLNSVNKALEKLGVL